MRKFFGVLVVALLLCLSLGLAHTPALAAPAIQGGGGVHFGPYTLASGNYFSEDLVVFGGPVLIEDDAEFDGDLTVFGPLEIEDGGRVSGQLVVMGEAEIAGTVEGDIFTAGQLTLRETALIEGDVASVGELTQEDGAIIEGEFTPVDEDEGFPMPITPPFEMGPFEPEMGGPARPLWWRGLWRLVRGAVNVIIMSLLALVVVSLWPNHVERVGRTIEEAPLTAYGMGLLALILFGLVALLLTITICLSPFAIVGLIIVSIGLILGWISLGMLLGRRVLVGLFSDPHPRPVVAALVGTGLLTFILALARVVGPLHSLLLFLLVPPVAGAVLLTRFGTLPYATQGGSTQGGSGIKTPPVPPTPPTGDSALPPVPPQPPAVEDTPPAAEPPPAETPPPVPETPVEELVAEEDVTVDDEEDAEVW